MCMANTDPVNDCASVTAHILDKASQAGLARVYPIGAITKGMQGESLAEMGELAQSGCVAVSDDGRPVHSGGIMRRAIEYSAAFGLLVIDARTESRRVLTAVNADARAHDHISSDLDLRA